MDSTGAGDSQVPVYWYHGDAPAGRVNGDGASAGIWWDMTAQAQAQGTKADERQPVG